MDGTTPGIPGIRPTIIIISVGTAGDSAGVGTIHTTTDGTTAGIILTILMVTIMADIQHIGQRLPVTWDEGL